MSFSTAFFSLIGLLGEGRDADISDVVQRPRTDRLDLDHVALEHHVERLLVAAPDRELDLGICRPTHLVDRFRQGQAEYRFAIEMRDDVARKNAGAGGRGLIDRRDHLDHAIFHGDLDAEPAELALGLDLHIFEVLRAEIARMRVERRQHAIDRRFDQFFVGDLFDVVGANAFEHLAEQVQLPVCLRGVLGESTEGYDREN